jgi:hypothetical protein
VWISTGDKQAYSCSGETDKINHSTTKIITELAIKHLAAIQTELMTEHHIIIRLNLGNRCGQMHII